MHKEIAESVSERNLFGDGLCQVLTRLCLASTCRSFWSTTEIQLQRSHQSPTQTPLHLHLKSQKSLTPLFLGFKVIQVIDVGTPGMLVSSAQEAATLCLSATVLSLDELIAVK